MVSVLTSSAVDRALELRSGQTKYYQIGFCCFCAKHAAWRRKDEDWLVRNQYNILDFHIELSIYDSPYLINDNTVRQKRVVRTKLYICAFCYYRVMRC